MGKVQPHERFERWGYWRTEPAIDAERQQFLAERRAVKPEIGLGIYPFRDENGSIKLTRADVEWLLATHQSCGVTGPVVWEAESDKPGQKQRKGLDLSGANLRQVDLSRLPLACLISGLPIVSTNMWTNGQSRRGERSAIHLEEANLREAHLERAALSHAHMEGANLYNAHAELGFLPFAHMESADLRFIHLKDANLDNVHLEGAWVGGAVFTGAWLEQAFLAGASLGGTCFNEARLNHAQLTGAHLHDTKLNNAFLLDVHWDDAGLSDVNWAQVHVLGEESEARRQTYPGGTVKTRADAVSNFQDAVRANRQVAAALRNQGLNEDADRFGYRAQVLQREVLRRQGVHKWFSCVGSLLLCMLAGYGYRLWRILAAYGIVLLAFTFAYWMMGVHSFPHEPGLRAFWDSFLTSLSAIHGRTTFEQLGAWSFAAWIAAVESVVGIVIEGVFVAMLVQRFFAR